jgi:phosphoglycerate dehydrogenase-like enzyme
LERLLLVHEHAAAWLARLQRRFPSLAVEVCAEPDRLTGLLAVFRPTMAYSCKTEGIPGPAHRPLLDCPTLRWLHVGSSGYDHLAGWETRPFVLTNSRGVLAPFLAEAVMAALLALAFGLPRFLRQQRAGHWQKNPWRPLAGRTLLIVGTGVVGCEVARLARPFGLRTIGLNRSVTPLPNFDAVLPLEELLRSLAEADLVSLHLRLAPETRHIIAARALAALPPGAILVNTGRGRLVDDAALVAALRAGGWPAPISTCSRPSSCRPAARSGAWTT